MAAAEAEGNGVGGERQNLNLERKWHRSPGRIEQQSAGQAGRLEPGSYFSPNHGQCHFQILGESQ
jgi:hypothetical protein